VRKLQEKALEIPEVLKGFVPTPTSFRNPIHTRSLRKSMGILRTDLLLINGSKPKGSFI